MASVAAPVTTLPEIQEFEVPSGTHPHDVAPAPDGTVWFTAQATGQLGQLDRMREAGSKQVAFVIEEHLRLVDQPPERGGMHDAIPIALVFGAGRRGRFVPVMRHEVPGQGA